MDLSRHVHRSASVTSAPLFRLGVVALLLSGALAHIVPTFKRYEGNSDLFLPLLDDTRAADRWEHRLAQEIAALREVLGLSEDVPILDALKSSSAADSLSRDTAGSVSKRFDFGILGIDTIDDIIKSRNNQNRRSEGTSRQRTNRQA